MAWTKEYKDAYLKMLADAGGKMTSSDAKAKMASTGIKAYDDAETKKASDEGRITTSGVIKSGSTTDDMETLLKSNESLSPVLDTALTAKQTTANKTYVPPIGTTATEIKAKALANATPKASGLTTVPKAPTTYKDQPVSTTTGAKDTTLGLKNNLIQLEEKQKMADLSKSTQEATDAVNTRSEAIDPKYKGLRSDASVSTQLGQKRLKDLFASTGMADGTMASRQIASEQSLQSQFGSLDVQRASEEAQIQKDLTDIQTEKAYLETSIKNGTATATTTARLEQIAADEAEAKSNFINTIGAYYSDFQAEIDKIANDGDTSNDWKIPYLKQAREEKKANEGLDDQGNPINTGIQYTVSQALEAYRMGIYSPEVLDTLNASGYNVSNTTPTSSSGGGNATKTTTTSPSASKEVNMANLESNLNQMVVRGAGADDVLTYISKNETSLISEYGKDAVNAMYSGIVESKAGMQTEINGMTSDGLSASEMLDVISKNLEAFRNEYGQAVVADYIKLLASKRS